MKTLVITFLLLSNLFGQGWDFSGNFPNDNFKGGSGLQGMAVDPEGKVWITKYSREYYTIPGTTDSLFLRLIYVFNSDGSSASFSPIWKLAGPGFVDTLLESNNRGLRADQNGNIIYVSGNQIMYRINYLNGEGMNKVFLDLGTSPTAPAITASGKIFVGPVVNTNGPLKEFDSNFNFISNAVTFTQTDFTRSIEVDLDFGNNKIFFPAALNRKMIIVYQRPNELAPFDSVGTILDGISCESISFNKVSRKLWVSGGSYQSLPAPNSSYSPNVWYEYDIMSNSILDSIVWQMNFPNNINERPRAIDFSPDGNIAYVGCFGSSDYPMVQKFTRIVLPVELLSFEYFIDKQNIQLKWVTSSELNNGGFQLERKQINTWQSIGFVQGNGTTTETKVYSFIDTP